MDATVLALRAHLWPLDRDSFFADLVICYEDVALYEQTHCYFNAF